MGGMSARLKVVLGATVLVGLATVALFALAPGRSTAPGSAHSPKAQPARARAPTAQAIPSAANGKLALAVTENGFTPDRARVQAGVPLTLEITRKTDATCATAIVIPGYGIQRELPLNQTVAIAFTPKQGGELRYGCAHGQMVSGVLVVE